MITNIVTSTALSVVRLLQFLIFARAIASWFPQVASGQIGNFLYSVTEPILMPIRNFIRKLNLFGGMPIDFSVLAAFLILEIISTMLYLI